MYAGYLVALPKSSGNGGTLITSATVIGNILTQANWDDYGNYQGSLAGLVEGNFYFDDNYNHKYEFLANKLRRYTYNI